MAVSEILTRDLSSGRIHKRFVDDETGVVETHRGERTFEADNLDQAGDYEVIATTDDAEPGALCERCFPPLVPEVDSAL